MKVLKDLKLFRAKMSFRAKVTPCFSDTYLQNKLKVFFLNKNI